jgi:hypothetical protein
MPYFRVLDDNVNYADRWYLDEPLAKTGEEIDARLFGYGEPYDGVAPAIVPIQYKGKQVAFTLAAFDMPVVSTKVANIVRAVCVPEVQWFPVIVDDGMHGYEIMNAICVEDCVDEEASEVLKWRPEDGRPDKTGQYRSITKLLISPRRVANRHIFRVKGWEVALIVSDRIKAELCAVEDLGIRFEPVSA